MTLRKTNVAQTKKKKYNVKRKERKKKKEQTLKWQCFETDPVRIENIQRHEHNDKQTSGKKTRSIKEELNQEPR